MGTSNILYFSSQNEIMSIDFRTTLNTKIIASKQINHKFEAKNEIIDVY